MDRMRGLSKPWWSLPLPHGTTVLKVHPGCTLPGQVGSVGGCYPEG